MGKIRLRSANPYMMRAIIPTRETTGVVEIMEENGEGDDLEVEDGVGCGGGKEKEGVGGDGEMGSREEDQDDWEDVPEPGAFRYTDQMPRLADQVPPLKRTRPNRYAEDVKALDTEWSRPTVRQMMRMAMLKNDIIPHGTKCMKCNEKEAITRCKTCQFELFMCEDCDATLHLVH